MSIAWNPPGSPTDYEADRMPAVMSELKRGLEASAPAHQLQVLYAEPSRTFAGMIVYADGTTWNPGSGEGVYRRDKTNASWTLLGSTTSPGMVLLSTQTAASSATLDFTSSIDSTYDVYFFDVADLIPATDGVQLQMLTSTDAGSTWDGGTTYKYAFTNLYLSSGTTGVVYSGGASSIALTTSGSVGNGATQGVSGFVRLYSPASTAVHKKIIFSMLAVNTSDGYTADGAALRAATSDIDAVRFQMSSGNIASGSIRMYGVRKT